MMSRNPAPLAAVALVVALLCPASSQGQQVVDLSEAISEASRGVVQVINGSAPKPTTTPTPLHPSTYWTPNAVYRGTYEGAVDGTTGKLATTQNKNLSCGVLISESTVLTILLRRPKDDAKFQIRGSDDKLRDARPVAYDAVTGGALLKLDTAIPGARPLRFSNDKIRLGSPTAGVWRRGDGQLVAGQGIIATEPYWLSDFRTDLIDVDFEVHPGSMGGAVVNADGRLRGLIVAMSSSDGRRGPAKVVPVEAFQRLRKFVDEDAMVTIHGGRLGVTLDDSKKDEHTVTAKQITPETAAAKAGVKVGDQIVRINKRSVRTAEDLLRELARHRAGDKVTLEIARGPGDDPEKFTFEAELTRAPLRDLASSKTLSGWRPTVVWPKTQTQWLAPTYATPATPFTPTPVKPVTPYRPVQPKPVERPKTVYQPQPSLRYPPTPTRIQVERSNLEESIRKLTKQLEELRAELKRDRD